MATPGRGLTEEQKRRMEDNKRKALAKRAEKCSPVKQTSAVGNISRPQPGTAWKNTSTSSTNKSSTNKSPSKYYSAGSLNKSPLKYSAGSLNALMKFPGTPTNSTASAGSTGGNNPNRFQSNFAGTTSVPSGKVHVPTSTVYGQNSNLTRTSGTGVASVSDSTTATTKNSFYSAYSSNEKPGASFSANNNMTTTESNNYSKTRNVPSSLLAKFTNPGSMSSPPWKSKAPGGEAASSGQGANAFPMFGKQKPVKGSCVLITRDRFEVNVGYSAPLVEVFKSMKSRQYGKYV
jgi:hypothetical protein